MLYSVEPVLKYLILYYLYQALKKTHPHPVLSSWCDEGDLKITKNNRLLKNYLLSIFWNFAFFFLVFLYYILLRKFGFIYFTKAQDHHVVATSEDGILRQTSV